MLIDFTLENYRSIKEKVTLSAIAQKRPATSVTTDDAMRRVKPDDEIAFPRKAEGWEFELLPALAIFGANASGKTNVLRGLDSFLAYMTGKESESTPGARTISYVESSVGVRGGQQFAFDNDSLFHPTRFELRVNFNDEIYTYTLHVDTWRVLLEKLVYMRSNAKKRRLLYQRIWDDIAHRYDWKNGDAFSGPHRQLEDSISQSESFMSVLFRLSIPILEPLKGWLKGWEASRVMGISPRNDNADPGMMLKAYVVPEFLRKISDMIRLFDTGISRFGLDVLKDKNYTGDRNLHVYAYHTMDGEQDYRLPLTEESAGTQRLFRLAGRIIDSLDTGCLMLVDELEAHVHPNICREIVRLFQNPETNPKRAQLIFTSHDNTLQRNHLLRRDQIWFTQKRRDGSTELYSLSDFKVRNDVAIDKAYLDGRYGAVPILPEEQELAQTLAGRR